MSDEHKPQDDHGHNAGHGVGAGPRDDLAPAGPAAQAHDELTAVPGGDTPGHDDHAAQPGLVTHGLQDHTAHVAPAADSHDAHGHDATTPATPDQDSPGQDTPAHDDHAAPTVVSNYEHGHAVPDAEDHSPGRSVHDDPHDEHVMPAAAASAAVVAAAATTPSKPPVWSDAGDAPFETSESTPVYARGKKGKKTSGGDNEGFEIFKTIFFALLIAMVLRIVLFQPFTIPSASMEPNLYEGDYIVVSKWSYGYSKHAVPFSPPIFKGRILAQEPKRGDVVVFKLPRDNKTDYIKRLIGLPGDRIQMIDNVLHINGTAVRDVVVTGDDVTNMYGMPIVTMRETLPEGRVITIQDFGPGNDLDNTPVFEVPVGFYFMMGDNRDNSIDSRVEQSQGVGLVPAENLIGKAEIILFSWTPGASLWNPVSWFTKVRPSRFFTVLD